MEDKKVLSCIDCAVKHCNKPVEGGDYPAFCPTRLMNEAVLAEALDAYKEEENFRIASTAAEVETDGYCQWPRVQEVVEFARRMGYQKLGIATCVGLLTESRMLAKILRSHGFEVYGISCKAGATPKTAIGIDQRCAEQGENMCNPILQAKLLNEAGTELNIVMGLCVGHDSLFYKYSNAVVTTLVTKDRVTGHNPVAAIYNAESYFKKKLFGDAQQ